MPSEGERLQKVMARAGIASRRACEAIIVAGRVTVNGQPVTELGTRVNPSADRILVDGAPLPGADPLRYVALHKPVGYLSSASDPHGGPFATDLVPASPRVYGVGRLDRDSEGLMLFTNDGELALRLTHPRYEQEKEYRVLLGGTLGAGDVAQLREGIELPGKERPAYADVVHLAPDWRWRDESVPFGQNWIGLVLREGHKHEIREMLARLGIPVQRLIRVRMGTLELGALRPGEYRVLSTKEIADLHDKTRLNGKSLEREQD